MVVDYTITIGNIVEISTLAGGGVLAIISLRNSVRNMKDDLQELKLKVNEFGKVLIKMAVHDERLTNVEREIKEIKQEQRAA